MGFLDDFYDEYANSGLLYAVEAIAAGLGGIPILRLDELPAELPETFIVICPLGSAERRTAGAARLRDAGYQVTIQERQMQPKG